jgi:guanylate kinase
MKKQKMIIIAGISASGKTSIQSEMSKSGFHKVITATTRDPRVDEGEVDGVDYHFFSKDEFNAMIKDDKFAEFESHGDNIYGTPWSSLDNKDTIPCAILEPKGAKNLQSILQKKGWDVSVVWVDCSFEIARERILKRDSENPQALEKRLKLMDGVEQEWPTYMKYDITINGLDELSKSVKKIKKNCFKRQTNKPQ